MADLKELVDKVLDELELESVTGGTNPDANKGELARKLARLPAREAPTSKS